MSDNQLFIWGTGGHASVILDALEIEGNWKIAGFIDDDPTKKIKNYNVLSFNEISSETNINLVIGIGRNDIREKVYNKAVSYFKNINLVTVIHPKAVVSKDVSIGDGSVVMAGVVVNPGAVIGSNVILNTSCVVEHDCNVDDFASIGPRACIGGETKVGKFTSLGIGAVVNHGIKISNEVMIGAGSVVTKDVPANSWGYGVPYKVVRKYSLGENYL